MLTEEFLKEGLRRGDRKVIQEIYTLYHGRIASWVVQNTGSQSDAEDVFQDALTIIYQKTQEQDFFIQYKFYTYLFSICRNLWLKRLRDDRLRQARTENELVELAEEVDHFIDEFDVKQQIFRRKFAQLGKKCRRIIELSLQGKGLGEIAALMALEDERRVTKQKSYCKQKLAKLVKEDSLYKELKA